MKIKYDFNLNDKKGFINFEDLNDQEFDKLRSLFQSLIQNTDIFNERSKLLQELNLQSWVNKLSRRQ